MKSILLLGLGEFGMHMAAKLSELNHEVMAIDAIEKRVEAVADMVTNAQIGDCTNKTFMQSLGIQNYDVCIVALGDNFQVSLECTDILQELNAKFVVAQVGSDVQAKLLLKNGANEIVYPEKQLAAWAAVRYTMDNVFDYVELDHEHAIFEVKVPESWVGKTVVSLDIRRKYSINILAVKRDEQLMVTVLPDTKFTAEERVLVLGNMKDIHKCFKM